VNARVVDDAEATNLLNLLPALRSLLQLYFDVLQRRPATQSVSQRTTMTHGNSTDTAVYTR